MKKLLSLITLLACAGSLYAAEAGTLTPSSVTFEEGQGYVADTVISNTFQEAGKAENEYQWWSAGSDEGETGTIKLYNVAAENPSEGEEGEGGEAAPASETEAGLPKYNYGEQNVGNFANLGPGDQYLNVETTTGKPLYRTLATWENNFLWVTNGENGVKVPWNGSGDPDENLQQTEGWYKEYQVTNITDIAGVEIGSEGKVIDTLVQFTASETAPELADGDKLVVWLKQQTEDDKPTDWQDEIKVGTKYVYTWTDTESGEERTVESETELSDDEKTNANIPLDATVTPTDVMEANVWPCFTNLMVTAGQLASGGTVVKQDFKVSESVEPDKWYRLTIRAIENVTTYTGKQSGFAIYLDGVAVACMDDDYAEKLLDGFEVEKLSSTAKDLYNNKQLFISAVSSTSGASVLTAVGFDGTGKIDDLTINTVENGPQFAMGKRLFKVEWDDGLTGFTIVAKGSDDNVISTTPFSIEGGAGAKEFDFAAGAETYEISALTFASGSTLSQVSATGAAQSSDNGVYSFTELDFAPVVKIGVDTILATVDGTTYSNFAEAIAAAKAGKTLYLAADMTLDGTSICVGDGEDLEIDLQGHDILYANPQYDNDTGNPFPLFYVTTGKLTILDSVGGGVIGWATQDDMENGLYLVDGVTYNTPNEDETYVGSVIVGNQTDKGATFAGGVNQLTAIWSGKFDFALNADNRIDGEGNDLPWTDWTFFEGGAVVESSNLSQSEEQDEEGVPLYWVVTQGAGGETPDPEYTITINGVDAANATVTVDGNAYNAQTTYKYTGTDVVIVATANTDYTYTGVSADGWTIAGDGTTATYTVSNITTDVTVNVPAAVTKPAEGLTSWDDVDGDTEVSNVVNTATYEALTNANANSMVTAVDIKTWALKHNVSFATGGILVSVEALMLNCADEPAVIAAAKDDFKVDDTIFNQIMANLTDLTKVNFSSLATTYPCAAFRVKEVTLGEGEPSENAKFYKLEMTLK